MLYPRAALALYSMDPSRPSYPVLRSEWLQSNFPLLKGVQPAQASVDGQRVLSSTKGDRHELTFSLAHVDSNRSRSLLSECLHATCLASIAFLTRLLGRAQHCFPMTSLRCWALSRAYRENRARRTTLKPSRSMAREHSLPAIDAMLSTMAQSMLQSRCTLSTLFCLRSSTSSDGIAACLPMS